jgi:hypothetical protein
MEMFTKAKRCAIYDLKKPVFKIGLPREIHVVYYWVVNVNN